MGVCGKLHAGSGGDPRLHVVWTFLGGFHHALQIHPFGPGANVPLRRGGGEPTHPGQGDRNREQPEHDRRATSSRPDEGDDLLRRVSSRFDGAPNRAYDGPRAVAGRATKGGSAGQRRTVIGPLSVHTVGRAPAPRDLEGRWRILGSSWRISSSASCWVACSP